MGGSMIEQVKFAIATISVLFFIGCGWVGRGFYQDSLELAIQRAADASAAVSAAQIAQIKIENTTITNKTVEKIKTDVVYRDCAADTAMMDLTNKSRAE